MFNLNLQRFIFYSYQQQKFKHFSRFYNRTDDDYNKIKFYHITVLCKFHNLYIVLVWNLFVHKWFLEAFWQYIIRIKCNIYFNIFSNIFINEVERFFPPSSKVVVATTFSHNKLFYREIFNVWKTFRQPLFFAHLNTIVVSITIKTFPQFKDSTWSWLYQKYISSAMKTKTAVLSSNVLVFRWNWSIFNGTYTIKTIYILW